MKNMFCRKKINIFTLFKKTANLNPVRKLYSLAGFTLLEIVIIILILSVLSAVAAPKFLNIIERQKVKAAEIVLKDGYMSQRRYYIDNNDAWADDINDLDLELVAPEGFNDLIATLDTFRILQIRRDRTEVYWLKINADGDLTCASSGSTCQTLGF